MRTFNDASRLKDTQQAAYSRIGSRKKYRETMNLIKKSSDLLRRVGGGEGEPGEFTSGH